MRSYSEIPDKSIVREFVYGEDIGWRDEMVVRQSRYSDEHGTFGVEVVKDESSVRIFFKVMNDEHVVDVSKYYGTVNEYAEPFDWVTFDNVELASVVLRDDVEWASEYFLATYWGEPVSEGHEDFVRDNVRILQRYHVPRGSYHSLPESATVDETFDTTDVRTYTNVRPPNPWCRCSLAVLYVNREVCRRILLHDACSLTDWRFVDSPPYVGSSSDS